MINDTDIERALDYVRDQATNIGRLRGLKSGLEHEIKIIRSQAFLEATGTVAEREAKAYVTKPVRDAVKRLQDTITELATTETLFKAAELKIEAWRTMNANQRRGNI